MAISGEESDAALDLVKRAAGMFEMLGNDAAADRLRHAIAIIAYDDAALARLGLERPLALMRQALALLDGAGLRLSQTAIDLQSAIDAGRVDEHPAGDQGVDLALIAPRTREPSFDHVSGSNNSLGEGTSPRRR